MKIDDKKLNEWSKNISYSLDLENTSNENFAKYYGYVFDKCLTEDDLTALKKTGRNTLDFSTLRPFVMHAMKAMQDAMPTTYYASVETEDEDFPEIPSQIVADQLSSKLKEILKYSYFDNVVYAINRDLCVGGKGIFKIHTDYINNYNFQQTFFISQVKDVSKIFFDPLCKNLIKDDARWVAEKIGLPEDQFKEQFPSINIDGLDSSTDGGFAWVESAQDRSEKIINVVDYYYVVSETKTVYLDEHGNVGEEKTDATIKTRELEDKSIWRVRYCGKHILEKASKTVFKSIPFVYVPAESYIDKNGKVTITPYAKHGFDAMRSKNFILNYYMGDVLNNPKHTSRVDVDAITTGTMEALRNPQDGDIQPFKSTVKSAMGQGQPTAGIIDVPRPQLPNELLQAATEMDTSLAAVFGTQFPSLNDLNNVSGKALYNLSQYMSASTEVLMQNLLQGIVQVGNLIKEGMPEILREEQITFMDKESGEEKQVMFDYMYNPSKYRVIGERGVSTRLQKEANLESLIGLSQSVPAFGAFLSSPQVMMKLLEIMELDDQSAWLKLWEEFQQQQSQQQGQPNPEEQAQQQVNQINQTKAQASLTTANANMLNAQTKKEELPYTIKKDNLNIQVNAAKVTESRRSTNLKTQVETAKINQKHTMDLLNHAGRQ